jgi:hypothetical protein
LALHECLQLLDRRILPDRDIRMPCAPGQMQPFYRANNVA